MANNEFFIFGPICIFERKNIHINMLLEKEVKPYSVKNPVLKVYVNKDLMLDNRRPVPLLMHLSPDDTEDVLLYWNKLREKLRNSVEVVYYQNIEEVDGVIVIPNTLRNLQQRKQLPRIYQEIKLARKHKKKVIVFNGGVTDYSRKGVSYKFDTNLTASDSSMNTEMLLPNWLYDLNKGAEDFEIPVSENPGVNFTGNIDYNNPVTNIVKHFYFPPFVVNYLARSRAVDVHVKNLYFKQIIARLARKKLANVLTQNCQQIHVNLVERKEPFFGLPAEEREKRKIEYRENIYKHLYTIVIRGDGNGFFQLYEVMSAGRIPIIIDTNMALPGLINYKWEDFALIVPFNDLEHLETYILDFHHRHSHQELVEKCKLSRAAYEELLPHNYVFNWIIPRIQKVESKK